MSSVEALARLSAQARGDMPTQVVRREGQVMYEYDTFSALVTIAKVLGLPR